MNKLIIIILFFLSLSAFGQKTMTDSVFKRLPDSTQMIYYQNSAATLNNYGAFNFSKTDTVRVIGYCLIDKRKLVFKWRHLYAVFGLSEPYINFNGLLVYKKYLMPDRKTSVKFKVIYAVEN
jgi:hypothetical protein